MFLSRKKTFVRLNQDYHRALQLPFDSQKDKYVIFSDLHMADYVDRVDDFKKNEMVLCHALNNYLKRDYGLILNGDIEEAWEAKPQKILNSYKDTVYSLEKAFALKGQNKHVRIFGNHDNLWTNPLNVKKYLWPVVGEVEVFSGVRLGDDIFITHGHQGDLFGDTIFSVLSKGSIRYGWRVLQRAMNLTNARASRNHLIRKERDDALYRWALSHNSLVIAGHTHRPMFGEPLANGNLVSLIAELEAKLVSDPSPWQIRASIEALKEHINSKGGKGRVLEQTPYYFNSGCCVNTNGITGIEIEEGKIRLVKWELTDAITEDRIIEKKNGLHYLIERRVYNEALLSDIIEQINRKKDFVVHGRSSGMDAAA